MKRLVFEDSAGNAARYELFVPEAVDAWNLRDCRDYLTVAAVAAHRRGYLFRPVHPLMHSRLRELVHHPEATLNPPVRFEQDRRPVAPDGVLHLHRETTVVHLGRDPAAPRPGIGAVDVAARNRRAFAAHAPLLTSIFDRLFDFPRYPVLDGDGEPVGGMAHIRRLQLSTLPRREQLRFFARVAGILHQAPFENYSKFLTKIKFRSGCEVWQNIDRGFGGVCSEKTAALKFICDILDVPTRHVLASPGGFRADHEERMADFVDGRGPPPEWAQHHLLEMRLEDVWFLLDVTGGNLPLLFLHERDSDAYFRRGYRGRMVFRHEHFELRRVAQATGDALLTLSEFHLPQVHFDLVFKQGLGLAVHPDLHVGVFFDWGGERRALYENFAARRGRRQKLPFPVFLVHGERPDARWDPEYLQFLETVRDAMHRQVPDPCYTGGFTFVLQPLAANFWRLPIVSDDVRRHVDRMPQPPASASGRQGTVAPDAPSNCREPVPTQVKAEDVPW